MTSGPPKVDHSQHRTVASKISLVSREGRSLVGVVSLQTQPKGHKRRLDWILEILCCDLKGSRAFQPSRALNIYCTPHRPVASHAENIAQVPPVILHGVLSPEGAHADHGGINNLLAPSIFTVHRTVSSLLKLRASRSFRLVEQVTHFISSSIALISQEGRSLVGVVSLRPSREPVQGYLAHKKTPPPTRPLP